MFRSDSLKTMLAAGALAVVAGGASAATVLTVDDEYPGVSPFAGTATCSETCEGLVAVGPSVWATDGAKLFTVHPPNDSIQRDFVNGATGNLFGIGNKTELEEGEGANYSFFTDALYILMKIGGGSELATFLIHNTFGKGLEITWNQVDGGGNGLSHYTEFGEARTPPIPVPAAGFLLIGALGGLAALRRRRRA
jgi:hypothetical protein